MNSDTVSGRGRDELPRLGVLYEKGSASPLQIVRAAMGVCLPLIAYDPRREPEDVAGLIDGLGCGLRARDCDLLRVFRRLGVRGIVTFAEPAVERCSEIAHALGLVSHRPEVTAALTNKALQRGILNGATRPVRYEEVRAQRDVLRAFETVGVPAVAKPVRGWGSRGVRRLSNYAAFEQLARDLASHRLLRHQIIEEEIAAYPIAGRGEFGDYCSVETIAYRGQFHHYLVSDRTRLRPPYRETGIVVPSSLDADWRQKLMTVTSSALAAVGARDGAFHTELKLTLPMPTVIEVNGRVGGGIATLLQRLSEFNVVRETMRVALGDPPSFPNRICNSFGAWWVLHCEASDAVVTGLPSEGAFREIGGVWRARVRRDTPVTVRASAGLDGALGEAFVECPDVESLVSSIHRLEALAEEIRFTTLPGSV